MKYRINLLGRLFFRSTQLEFIMDRMEENRKVSLIDFNVLLKSNILRLIFSKRNLNN